MRQIWIGNTQGCDISPADRGLAYGDGIFATMRTNKGHILYLDTHLKRLSDGAYRLGFSWQASSELINELLSLAKKNPHSCIKILLTRGEGGRGYEAPSFPKPMIIISVNLLPDKYKKWHQQGAKLVSSDLKLSYQPLLAGMKHLNRLEQVLIKSQKLTDYDDYLVCDYDNCVIETSMANIYFIKGSQVFTPKLSSCGVSGVMRQHLIAAFVQNGFTIFCQNIQKSAINTFDHALISNSLLGLVDITQIDHMAYKRFNMTNIILNNIGFPHY